MSEFTICERLRSARKSAGVTQNRLAEILGVAPENITQWENPRYHRAIPPHHIPKIAKALGIDPGELVSKTVKDSANGVTTYTLAEKQLLRLFRLMPEELQLVQLAQFIESASASDFGRARRDHPRADDVSVSGGAGGEPR